MVSALFRRNTPEKKFLEDTIQKERRLLDQEKQLLEEKQKLFEREKPDYVFLAAAKVGGILANNTYRAEF